MMSEDDMDQTYTEFEEAYNKWKSKKTKDFLNEYDNEEGTKEEGIIEDKEESISD